MFGVCCGDVFGDVLAIGWQCFSSMVAVYGAMVRHWVDYVAATYGRCSSNALPNGLKGAGVI